MFSDRNSTMSQRYAGSPYLVDFEFGRGFADHGQQLPTESQVLEDEVLPGTENADQPTEETSERHDHSRNNIGKVRIDLCEPLAKLFIQLVYDVLARHRVSQSLRIGPLRDHVALHIRPQRVTSFANASKLFSGTLEPRASATAGQPMRETQRLIVAGVLNITNLQPHPGKTAALYFVEGQPSISCPFA
jgi:hypothetical protein